MRTQEERRRGGQFYRPRHPVVEKMCATCPFGNERAFDNKVFSLGVNPGNADITTKEDAVNSVEAGHDFMCHGTVYRDGLKKAPDSEWMLCKGGVLWRRGEI